MPAIISATPVMPRGPAISRMSPKAASAPAKAPNESHAPAAAGKKAEINTTASQPPDDVPSVKGEVMGFCVSCCRRLPTKPSSAPPMAAAANRGSVPKAK